MERQLQFADLAGIRDASSLYGQHGDDYIVCVTDKLLGELSIYDTVRPCGLCLCLLREGEIQCEIDLKPYRIVAPAVISLAGKSVFRNERRSRCLIQCLFVSPRFLHDLSIDLNAINLHKMIETPPLPVAANLSEAEIETFDSYFKLLYRNAVDDNDAAFSKNIGRSIMQALLYQMLQFNIRNTEPRKSHRNEGPQNRQISYVQEFMRLLQLHHKIHRSISFYAERMCISPKYLSHIIKEATGRSASEWIAEFVVMEAKNMLRYSHKNIQQVAYELNFTTQSSFGKYFKHVTGLSPTDFQKS